MNPVQKPELEKEYTENKVVVSPEVKDLMMAAAQVLTDTEAMCGYLAKLDEAMLARYKEVLTQVDNTAAPTPKELAKKMSLPNRKADDPSRHLLSYVLAQYEKDSGFNSFAAPNGHPRVIQMTGTLSSADFKAIALDGHMAKDYVSPVHGVYTHRIQWYCLGQSGKLGEDLKGAFIKFQSGANAWLLTFDRTSGHAARAGLSAPGDTEFRVPERLHAWLGSANAKKHCPLVNEYIAGKDKNLKVNYDGNQNWLAVRKAVAARKLFPGVKEKLNGWKNMTSAAMQKTLTDVLTKQQQEELMTFLKTNALYPQPDGSYATTPAPKI